MAHLFFNNRLCFVHFVKLSLGSGQRTVPCAADSLLEVHPAAFKVIHVQALLAIFNLVSDEVSDGSCVDCVLGKGAA